MFSSDRSGTTHTRGPSPAPGSTIALSHAHINEAIRSSPDNGATLDLTHKNLTAVGESGAQELASVGRDEHGDNEGTVTRSVLVTLIVRTCSCFGLTELHLDSIA